MDTGDMRILSDDVILVKDVPNELAEEMRRKLVPVVGYDQKDHKGYTFKNRENIPIKEIAYTWIEGNDKQFPRVKLNGFLGQVDAVPIISFHRWGYYGFFKPSLNEVYYAIYSAMGDKWNKIKYFWLDSGGMGPEQIIGNYQYCKLWLWGTDALYVVDKQCYVHPIGLTV